MKKLVMAAALVAVSASSANAYVNIGLDFFDPPAPAPVYYAPPQPVYVQPAPVYVERPVYYGNNGYWRHREYDWNYWHGGRPGPHPVPRGPVHGGPGWHR